MSDTLNQTAPATTPKKGTGDNTPDPGDCCTLPPPDQGPST
ncbi:MAG TPA: hypothetical protein VIJ36_15000 [Thermoanaerobaculia bacterium]